jgi:hypothetical protein
VILSTLDKIIIDESFQREIKDLFVYAPNIKHERFIAYFFNKYLIQNNINAVLEKGKHDLMIYDESLEIKFHFDFDILKYQKEFLEYSSLEEIISIWNEKGRSRTWSVIYGIANDIVIKKCNYFVWIISERDYNSYYEQFNENFCLYRLQKYFIEKGIKKDISYQFQPIVDNFLAQVQKQKNCELKKYTINSEIPKTKLHFYILKLNN